MDKKFTVRLDDSSVIRLNNLQQFYEERSVVKYSYNDLLKLALRALSEDCELE